MGVEKTMFQKNATKDSIIEQASFCRDLPSCFRTMVPWAVLSFESIVVRPYIAFGNSKLFPKYDTERFRNPKLTESAFPTHVASSFVVACAYLFSFILLFLSLKMFSGALALLGLGLVPIVVGAKGLTTNDAVILLYWSVFIVSLPYILKIFDNKYSNGIKALKNIYGYLFLAFLWGLIGSWVVENTGVAFSITLFVLAVTKKYHGKNRPYWPIYFSSCVGTLLALGIAWVMVHRHPDVFWVTEGRGIEATWDVYSSNDRLVALIVYSRNMIVGPAYLAVFAFFGLLIFGKRICIFDNEKFYYQTWVSGACLIGFGCTAIAGLWMGAGYDNEWQRQLLPMSFLFTWWIFSLEMWLFGKYREPALNYLISLYLKRKPKRTKNA